MAMLQSATSARPTTASGRAFVVNSVNSNDLSKPVTNLPTGINPLLYALSQYRQHKYTQCIQTCTGILILQPLDKAAYLLKLKALTAHSYIDDTDIDDNNLADQLLDENSINKMARPGTSLKPQTSANSLQNNSSGRPTTGSIRPTSGYVRIGTANRQGTARSNGRDALSTALRSGIRPSTSTTGRPMTTNGRSVRLGTQSMLAINNTLNGEFIDVNRIDMQKYNVKNNKVRQGEAKLLIQYLMYVTQSYKHAAELASVCTAACEYSDVYWKYNLGKIYYALGIYRDSEKQLLSVNKSINSTHAYLQLYKLYCKLDQPNTALDILKTASQHYKHEITLLQAQARIHDQLNQSDTSIAMYKQVLQYNAVNIEAIACLARQHFYSDAPEIALRLYQRLLQLGLQSTELYNNIALCAFYSQQYDVALAAYNRALQLCDDTNTAEIWYNISHIFISQGDINLAVQCLKLCISYDSQHVDAWNNIGVIELYRNNIQQAKTSFVQACKCTEQTYESYYNNALLAYKLGDFQDAFQLVHQALNVEPTHTESQELLKQLNKHFNVL